DGGGPVYATVPTCSTRSSCNGNDYVLLTSADGTTWNAPKVIPTGARTAATGVLGGGIGVDRATSGANAKVGVFYYSFVDNGCSGNCQLLVNYVSSANGGSTWTSPVVVAGPIAIADLPPTTLGAMVGDYISVSVSNGIAHSV